MFAFIGTLLGLIPGISSLVSGVTSAWFNSKVRIYQSKMQCTRDVAVAAIQESVKNNETKVNWILALAQNPVMMFIVLGFAMPWIILEWKVIVYDNVWAHWGVFMTDPVRGEIGEWGGLIIGGIFVTSTGVGITHAIINRTREN